MPALALLAGIGLGSLFERPVLAQDGKELTPVERFVEAGCRMDVDLATLLTSNDVFSDRLQGQVWTIQAGIGKKLFQIPLLFYPGSKEFLIEGNLIKVGSARFLAYRLDDYGEKSDLWALHEQDMAQVNAGRKVELKPEELLFAPPRYSKDFTLVPGERIKWSMDRLPPTNAEVRQDTENYYTYKLKPQKLQETRPQPPDQRSMRTPEERAQFQLLNIQYRRDNTQWMEKGKLVRELTDKFEDAMPTRIWAVFEIPAFRDELAIQSGPPPLPWTVKVETLDYLRSNVNSVVNPERGLDGSYQLSADDRVRVLKMDELAKSSHPYDKRLAATYLVQTKMVQLAQIGEPLFFVLQGLLEGSDDQARSIIINRLTRMVPTRGTAELLKLVALRTGKDVTQAARALDTMLKVDLAGASPEQIQDRVATVNRLLADEKGPAVEQILAPLLGSVSKAPQALPLLAKSVSFQGLPPDRLLDAVVFAVENAGVEPLAALWLDEKFLGSLDRDLSKTTLDIIANSNTGARDLGPVFDQAVNALFGPPAAGQKGTIRRARLRRLIPIETTQHAIFRALQHGDPAISRAAWQALSRFQLVTMESFGLQEDPRHDRYQLILQAALDQIPTPSEVVPFLVQQPDGMRVAQCLTQIVLRGSRGASASAMRSLVGSGAPLDRVMLQLNVGERQGFAMLAYQIAGQMDPPPLVANTLRRRDDNNPVAAWFGQQIAEGRLPHPSSWAAQFRDADDLLELMVSNDDEMARGAAGTLLASIGGTDRMAMQFLVTVKNMQDQTIKSLNKVWTEEKQKVFALQLQPHQGAYRLLLRVAEPQQGADAAKVLESGGANELALGVVQMTVDPRTNRLSLGSQSISASIAPQPQSIQIDKPVELKSFPNEEAAKLPYDKVKGPVTLTRGSDGIWRGRFNLPNGSLAELVMTPLTEGSV